MTSKAQGSTESLIPILYAELGSAQAAADHTMAIVRFTVQEFDTVAHRLLQRFAADPLVAIPLQSFVDGCRYYCTGNLSWRYGRISHLLKKNRIPKELVRTNIDSLSTGRYGVYQDLNKNEIHIKL